MFEILMIALFCWLFFCAIRLFFKIAWGLAKILAIILAVLALPVLIVFLLLIGGLSLLVPVGMIALAWIVLRACV